jgi:DNA-binding NtrC family response regulator
MPSGRWSFEATSERRRLALDLARRVAPASCPILITGPTGVGKDVLAEDVHRHSRRSNGPFIAVNCAALSTSLFESELFGHCRGAYTSAVSQKAGLVELADGGTLFLDEIGELPLEAQAKLLRFLAKGTFWPIGATTEKRADVRIVAATNRDLGVMSAAPGQFREDLFFRLSVITISIPPLNPADARVIARTMAADLAAADRLETTPGELSALAELCAAVPWRGGAREMRNAVVRYFLLREPRRAVAECFQAAQEAHHAPLATASPAAPCDAGGLLEQVEDLVFLALARDAGDVRELSRRVDRSQQAVYERLKKLGVKPRDLGSREGMAESMHRVRGALEPHLPWLQAILKG